MAGQVDDLDELRAARRFLPAPEQLELQQIEDSAHHTTPPALLPLPTRPTPTVHHPALYRPILLDLRNHSARACQ